MKNYKFSCTLGEVFALFALNLHLQIHYIEIENEFSSLFLHSIYPRILYGNSVCFSFSPPSQVLYTKNSLPSITYYYFSEFPVPKEYNRGVGCVQPIVKRNTLLKMLTYDWNNYIFCYT